METAALYITGMALGIRCVSLCLATVNGMNGRGMDDEPRRRKEELLIHLALEGLVCFARSREKGGGR